MDCKKTYNILKYGKHMPHKFDIDINTIDREYRVIQNIHNPDGIYQNIAEYVENELDMQFEEYCYQLGIDIEINRHSNKIIWEQK